MTPQSLTTFRERDRPGRSRRRLAGGISDQNTHLPPEEIKIVEDSTT
jgi:hypothetical protein